MFYYHRPSCITWQSRFSVRANGLWVYGAAGRVKTVIQYHTIRHLTVQLSTCDLISSVQSQRNSRSTFFVSLCWQITRTSKAKLRNMTTAACCFRSTSLPSSFSIHKKFAVKRNSNAVSFMGLLSFSPKTSSFSTGLISISLKQRRSKNSFQGRIL